MTLHAMQCLEREPLRFRPYLAGCNAVQDASSITGDLPHLQWLVAEVFRMSRKFSDAQGPGIFGYPPRMTSDDACRLAGIEATGPEGEDRMSLGGLFPRVQNLVLACSKEGTCMCSILEFRAR